MDGYVLANMLRTTFCGEHRIFAAIRPGMDVRHRISFFCMVSLIPFIAFSFTDSFFLFLLLVGVVSKVWIKGGSFWTFYTEDMGSE